MPPIDPETLERIETRRSAKINTGIGILAVGCGTLGTALSLETGRTIMLILALPILLASLCWLWLAERSYRKEKLELKRKAEEPNVYEKRGLRVL
jgi:hypothetical protein